MVENKNECVLNSCPNHPAVLERLAILETTLQAMGDAIKQAVKINETISKNTQDELRLIRQNIQNGLLGRHTPTMTTIVSVLTGLLCAFAAAVVTHLLKL